VGIFTEEKSIKKQIIVVVAWGQVALVATGVVIMGLLNVPTVTEKHFSAANTVMVRELGSCRLEVM
jgi:hypothetical protein